MIRQRPVPGLPQARAPRQIAAERRLHCLLRQDAFLRIIGRPQFLRPRILSRPPLSLVLALCLSLLLHGLLFGWPWQPPASRLAGESASESATDSSPALAVNLQPVKRSPPPMPAAKPALVAPPPRPPQPAPRPPAVRAQASPVAAPSQPVAAASPSPAVASATMDAASAPAGAPSEAGPTAVSGSASLAPAMPGPLKLSGDLAVVCATRPAPAYPALSRRLGETGKVVVRVLLDREGRVAEATIEQSSTYTRLDEAALAAVRHWRCAPAQRAGQPVAATALQPFSFVLDAY